ncbi:response regulator transcription factor [Niallia nealsonii]|uniref:Stage 0 sporulation protein A homolog n=1 Tax=Niallia nealsonii TaxID=115979 RepID=A0A2N0Z824_9BACI|nr:response regulator [Niallia nealsonii]PKG25658.1 hypothetical protein CWS01_00045 [Niallia nealsonii]
MKVLIIDDEFLVRAGLKSMLEELSISSLQIIEAANGKEALQLLKKEQPDLVFIDIQMPKLNGLEVIQKTKESLPQTAWIILTGYAEFSYAHAALKLGIEDYLLKPVSIEELERAIDKRQMENAKYYIEQNIQFENELIRVINGLSSFQENTTNSALQESNFLCSVFFLDSHLEEKQITKTLQQFSHSLKLLSYDFIGKNANIAIFTLSTGELITVGAWNENKKQGKKSIEAYFANIQELLEAYRSNSFAITTIQSTQCHPIYEINMPVASILQLSPLRIIMGINRYWKSDAYANNHPNYYELCKSILTLKDYFKEKNYLLYMKVVGDLENYISSLTIDPILKSNIALFINSSMNCRLSAAESLDRWIHKLKEFGEEMLVSANQEKNQPDLIKLAISYIDENYMHNIGIGQIAELLQVTPNYLSTLFHKKTGTTFTKYITNTRILKAKELLLNPSKKVQEVAETVGYFSTRHFTKLFTEIVGCYPSEYRNQLKNNSLK